MRPSLICLVALAALAAAASPGAMAAPAAPAAPATPPEAALASPVAPDSCLAGARVVAYYFHRTMRCRTCLAIEAQAEQALRTGFAGAIESGELLWRPVNVDEERHAHFIDDFGIEGSTLLIARVEGGEVRRWKALEAVWELVGDREDFLAYVRAEAAALLQPE